MKILLLVIIICSFLSSSAQEKYFSAPLKIPLLLSGSFAELRSNHFHSGMDIKTQGVTGQAVSAAAAGYISRISVSPTGFGNALYINHPNGTTTLYGHLLKFRDDIQQYVRNIQYEKKSFQVDIQLLPGIFPVEKDELIALSGNTGSSGGPHLHFEIRDTQTEEPLNPLDFGFNIADKTPPTFSGLQITPLSDSSQVDFESYKKIYQLVFYDGKYHIANNPVVPVYGDIGFAFEAYDYFDGSPNRCGVSSIQLKIDGELYFSMNLHRFSYDETRYINSFIDYDDLINKKRKFQKTYIDPGNKLRMYEYNKNDGVFCATDNKIHQVDIETEDAYGNRSVLAFKIESKYKEIPLTNKEETTRFYWNQANSFEANDVELEIPKGNLFNSFNFRYQKFPQEKGYLSDLFQMDENTIPLFQGAQLKIRPINLNENLQDKALIVTIDPVDGKNSSVGGKYKDGWVSAEIKVLGMYAVCVDTIAPVIKPLSIANNNSLTEKNRIRFTITDDLSGIKDFEGYLDGKWALFEYDLKNHLITHYFDDKRFEMNKQHQLKLTITDNKNNVVGLRSNFSEINFKLPHHDKSHNPENGITYLCQL